MKIRNLKLLIEIFNDAIIDQSGSGSFDSGNDSGSYDSGNDSGSYDSGMGK